MPPTKNYPKITQIHPSKISNKKNTQNINWHNRHNQNTGPTTGNPRKIDATPTHRWSFRFCLWRIITFDPCLAIIRPRGPWMRKLRTLFGALRLPLTRGTGWTLGRVKCVPEFLRKKIEVLPRFTDFRIVSFGQNLHEKNVPPPPDVTRIEHSHPSQKNSQQPKSLEQLARVTFHQLKFLDR